MYEGVIVGGWSYVIAAYAITTLGLVAYLWSLRRRLDRANGEESPDEPRA